MTDDQKAAKAEKLLQDCAESIFRDAERYRWLRSRVGLTLRSDRGEWTRRDGAKFVASHYLTEGGTQHAPAPSLDETIDAAMAAAAERDGRSKC